MRRIKLHALIPNPVDSTSLYRGSGVISKLRYMMDIDIITETNINWSSLSYSDILFVQRPWGKPFKDAIRIAKNNGLPVWVDYDDDLLNVPDWNPNRNMLYGIEKSDTPLLINAKMDQTNQIMFDILNMADVITVTTQFLKDKFSKWNDNVIVIPNAFNDYMFDFKLKKENEINKIINWRGSNTHSEDLLTLQEELSKIQSWIKENNLNFIFNFIGTDAKNLKKLDYKLQNHLDPIEYFHYIDRLSPMIQICPLKDHDFNRAKSNIAWIEGTYSGAVCLAPDKYLPEFKRPGIIRYDVKDDDFVNKMKYLLFKDNSFAYENYKKSYNFIKDNLLLSKVNIIRKNIILELLGLEL